MDKNISFKDKELLKYLYRLDINLEVYNRVRELIERATPKEECNCKMNHSIIDRGFYFCPNCGQRLK